MSQWHIRPQFDDEQDINKLESCFEIFLLSRYGIYLTNRKCIDGAVIIFRIDMQACIGRSLIYSKIGLILTHKWSCIEKFTLSPLTS